MIQKPATTCNNNNKINTSNQSETKIKIILEHNKIAESLVLTAIKSPISTEAKTTPKNAPMQATKSNLSIFHIKIAALQSTRLMTAQMMIEARIAFGVYLKSGVMNCRVKNTTTDMTILETAVSQPAMKFTADREKEPDNRKKVYHA